MAFTKKDKPQASKGANVLNSAEERKKFKTALAVTTQYFQQIDDLKESVTENIGDLSAEYGLDKKTIRKLATTMYNHSYATLLEENRHFEELYEQVVEGKLRDDE